MLFWVILGCVAIAVLEVPGMNARGLKAERRTFWVVLTVGFVLAAAQVQRWPVPSPTSFLNAVFSPVSAMLGLH